MGKRVGLFLKFQYCEWPLGELVAIQLTEYGPIPPKDETGKRAAEAGKNKLV